MLGQVGALLKSKVGWRDTLSRLGGDEFGVLLANCSLEEAMRTAEDYLQRLDSAAAGPAGIDEAAAAFASETKLPERGSGTLSALNELVDRGLPGATASAGPP